MATYTPNYGLHQWEPSDSFLRTDFNTDFAKIDQALKQAAEKEESIQVLAESKVRMVVGYYNGTGNANTQNINLGFYPQALIIDPSLGYRPAMSATANGSYGGLAIRGRSVGNGDKGFVITSTGFYVRGFANVEGLYYIYLAFG